MPRTTHQLQHFTQTKKGELSKNSTDAHGIHVKVVHGTPRLHGWNENSHQLQTPAFGSVFVYLLMFSYSFIREKQTLTATQFSNTSFQDLWLTAREYCSVVFVTLGGLFVTMHFAKLFDRCLLTVFNKHNTHFTAFSAYLHHHTLHASVISVEAVFSIVSLKHSKSVTLRGEI